MKAETRSGYKMTELGLIPIDWDVNELFSVCDVRDGTHDSPKYFNTGVKFVTSKNIVSGSLDFADISYISDEDALEINKRSKVEMGDILMSMIGTIGNAVLIKYEPDFCIKNVALIKPKLIEGQFLIQLINSPFYQNYIKNNLDGGIQKFISLGVLRSLDCLLPPLPEQTAIATALKDTDDLINSLEKLIAKKKLIKQGAMQELLKPKEGWVKKKLGEVATILRGGSPRPIEFYLTTSPEGINWVKIGDVHKEAKYITSTEEKITKEGAQFSRFVNEGDFLLSNSMSFGRPYIMKINGCIHDGWLVIKEYSSTFDKDFLYYSLGSSAVMTQYKSMASGSGVLNLNKEIVKEVLIDFPLSIEEQIEVSTFLSELDIEIDLLASKLKKNQIVKQGMMQQLLTGKIRLPH
jgi:type I restriction enzyme S subunit